MANDEHYDAFISYNQGADGVAARAIQEGLERFGRPWYKRRALRVFLDVSDLAADPDLWATVHRQLLRAGHLVVLCSPGGAGSRWVGEEIEAWIAERGPTGVLPVVTSGDWSWPPDAEAVDNAIPPALGALGGEPHYIDLRFVEGPEDLSVDNSRFRLALARIAAAIRGVPVSDIEGRVIKERRRLRRVVGATVISLTLLTIAAVGGGVAAVRNADRAEREAQVARSRALAAESLLLAEDRLDTALLLASQAQSTAPTPEALDALVTLLQRSPGLDRHLHPSGDAAEIRAVEHLSFGPDDQTVAVAGPTVLLSDVYTFDEIPDGDVGALAVFDLASGSQRWSRAVPDLVTDLRRAENGHIVLRLAEGGYQRYDGQGTLVSEDLIDPGSQGRLSASGDRYIRSEPTDDRRLVTIDTATGLETGALVLEGEPAAPLERGHDERHLVDVAGDGQVRILDLETGDSTLIGDLGRTDAPQQSATDGVRLIAGWGDGAVRSLAPNRPVQVLAPVATPDDLGAVVTDVALISDGSVVTTNSTITAYDDDGAPRWSTANRYPGGRTVVGPDGATVATASVEGVLMLDAITGDLLDGRVGPGLDASRFGVQPEPDAFVVAPNDDGTRLAVVSGGYGVWDMTDGTRILEESTPFRGATWAGDRLLLHGATTQVWDLGDGDDGFVLEGDPGASMDAGAMTDDGRWAVLGGIGPTVTVLDFDRRFPSSTLDHQTEADFSLGGFGPFGDRAVVVDGDEIVVLPIDGGRPDTLSSPLRGAGGSIGVPAAQALLLSGGRVVVTTDEDSVVIGSDGRTVGADECALREISAETRVVSSDGTRYAVASIADVAVCDHRGRLIARLPAPASGFSSFRPAVALSADGERLALGGTASVEVVDVGDGSMLSSYEEPADGSADAGVGAVAFSPDGNRIGIGMGDGRLLVWDVAGEAELIAPDAAFAKSMAWFPSGDRIVIGTFSGIQVWDLEARRSIGGRILGPYGEEMWHLGVDPSGTVVVAADTQGGLVAHDLDAERLVEQACAGAGRTLSDDERRRYADSDQPSCATEGQDGPS